MDITTRDESTYVVADYLLDRLVELGLDRIFGVPGDYTLGLLDHVVGNGHLTWTGCTNELNAGYAADGYGRLRGIAAVCTTFGVGELSAINAIAGSYAEHVPVVHIVGAPATVAQREARPVHHTLGDGRFAHFMDMHAEITCARAALTAETAAAEIDRVLLAVRDAHLPGYLLLPSDVAQAPVRRPARQLPARTDTTDPEALAGFLMDAERVLRAAGSDVALLGGLMVHRLGATKELTALIEHGRLPFATTVWGKSLVEESTPGFLGIYTGESSDETTRRLIEHSACLIMAGVQFTDLNSGLFTQQITRSRTVEVNARTASVGAATYAPIELPTALAALSDLIGAITPANKPVLQLADREPAVPLRGDAPLDQETLWESVRRHLGDGDIVLADQGTAFYGMAPRRLPEGVTFVGQPLWASIGYTLPALLGACTAQTGRRGVLLIGDGAAQLTAQELSTIMAVQLPALIVVVDNDGYTVERAIHGPNEPYNDIAHWDWTRLPAALGGTGVITARAGTVGELGRALELADANPSAITVVQAFVPADDVPPLLASLTRVLGRAATRTA
ncbi:alpha-keto acid decarboxylase family protein [Microlunatus ginsengisoli]|uniref:Alpha-keto-acid decarboxylase n=1 Tax=Microlunatus ginsengisoli TaxID=363863 RepID=A0ABP6ZT67_9ACTN